MAKSINGTVVTIDTQGNALTDITAQMLADVPRDESVWIECEGHKTNSIFPADHGQGDMSYIAMLDDDKLVLALTGDSAHKFLGMKVGSSVRVRW